MHFMDKGNINFVYFLNFTSHAISMQSNVQIMAVANAVAFK